MLNHLINSDQITEKQIHHWKEIVKVEKLLNFFSGMNRSEIFLPILSFVSFTKQKGFP